MWGLPASGGQARRVLSDSSLARVGKRWPLITPDGKAIVYVSASSPTNSQRLAVMTLESGKTEEFDLLVSMPLGIFGDQLVYVSPQGGLMAVRFDNSRRRPAGDPLQLDQGVLLDPTAGAKAS